MDEDKEFSFKPLTQGLGFHQRKEDREAALFPFKKRYSSFRKPPTPNIVQRNQMQISPSVILPQYEEVLYTSGIDKKIEDVCLPPRVTPPLYKVFLAFIIDFFILSLFAITTFSPLALLSDERKVFLQSVLKEHEVSILIMLLFLIYYFSYFVFFEMSKGGTVGKSVLRIELIDREGSSITLKKSFQRALLTFFSVLLLGLPSLIGWINEWSQSEIVQK